MAVGRVTEKGPALPPLFEVVWLKRDFTPAGHQTTDLQTPVGVQVVHDPIIAFHPGEESIGAFEMGHKVRYLAGLTDAPGDLTRSHGQRVDQYPSAMANVFMFPPFPPALLGGFGRGFALQDLHAGLFITADHQAALLIERSRLGVELTDVMGFGIEIVIVAIEPVLTLMRLEINLLENATDVGPADRGIPVRRDNLVSAMYSTGLNSTTSLVTPQRTDRHGILDQKPPAFQLLEVVEEFGCSAWSAV
jgi:hypothetical protein